MHKIHSLLGARQVAQHRAEEGALCTALAASCDNAARGWDSCSIAVSLALPVTATLRAPTHLPLLHQQPWVPLYADSTHLLVQAAVPAEQLLPGHRQPPLLR